jgi:hypothetical protein
MMQDERATTGPNTIQALIVPPTMRLTPDTIDDVNMKIETAPTKTDRDVRPAHADRDWITGF